ncbi:hypothetical protein [Latilactobacillus curvatus]|uniref:hypothetical protein n=1 Tax=Latilactobacillus curvatus TaxID=28038 RepID=UPI0020A326F5|nr:hypothetical protein [Latilactobacillus curvatus]UTC13413.1 hypothetical protein A4W75_10570 [Latilactobacillus curvatus]
MSKKGVKLVCHWYSGHIRSGSGRNCVQRQHHQREVKIAQQQAKIKRQRQAQEAKKQRESQKVAAAKAKEERLKAESQPTIVAEQALDDYLKQIGFSGTALIVRDKQVLLDKGTAVLIGQAVGEYARYAICDWFN